MMEMMDIEKNENKLEFKDDVSLEHSSIYAESELTVLDMDIQLNDAVLSNKMKLINNALDQIGFTPYHLKLFFLSGMGYATDTQLTYIESNVRTFVNAQFGYDFPVSAITYGVGMCLGAIVWGLSGDLIGRRLAFNLSLLLSAIFTIMCGMMGTFASYNLFIILISFAAGGNLVLDTCVFLEFLAHKDQWLLTFFALFWGVGQTIAVLVSYAFLPNYSCTVDENTTPASCPSHENKGWRYVFYVNGSIVLVLAVLRLTVIRLTETPKFLVANNRDAEAVRNLQNLAEKYNRKCDLSLEDLQKCGTITSNHDYREKRNFIGISNLVKSHISILFSNKKVARSSVLLFISWFGLGIAYPLYSSFLPVYLATRGASISAPDTHGVYRDNLISNVSSIGGPMIAGLLLYYFPILGRRGVLCIGGLSTMAFLFGFTQVKTRSQMVAMTSCVYVTLYIYYGVIYAYTPEVMPSVARATGNALCLLCTRVATVIVPIIAYFANTSTAVPIWVCGACVGLIGLIALLLPFEPSKQRVI
jgi:MFS family permease